MEDWLRSIGLAERVGAFREHKITGDQLGELSVEDLRELGLTIGERRRFRRALAKLDLGQAGESATVLAVHRTTRAERRPLTVMFIDLVDSTGLGERLDPEDLIEVIRDYRELSGDAITQYGGNIAKFLGDGILAYFCYPVANENDPERAVRAALDIVQGIGNVETPLGSPIQVRIGLATGPVIVGDLFAGGEVDASTIIGSTPNLAARLQSLAGPDQIVIAERTHSRIRSRFMCEAMCPVQLKGFDQTHQPWRISGIVAPRGQPGVVARPRRLTAFHGRQAELDVLQNLWSRAAHGDGNVALVIGEPGIGKSRLVEQFLEGRPPDATRIVSLAASSFDEDSPLQPFREYLRAEANLELDDAPDQAVAKLEVALAGDADWKTRSLPILMGLIGFPVADPAVAQLPPEQLRQRTISALIDHIAMLAEGRPLCLIIEDLHWLDPTSSELLELMLERLPEHRIFALLTARDNFAANWMTRSGTTVLRLARLSPEYVAAIMQDLFGASPISPQIVDQVANKTEGAPLFVEEVARTLLDRQPTPDQTVTPLIEPELGIPASLAESLMGRLDRSGAKEVAQVAAVVGRAVRRDMLAAVSGMKPGELEQPLSALLESGVLEHDVRAGGDAYIFSHALLRDAAYGTLLRDRRKELHKRVARAFESVDPEQIARHPEIIALHLTEAGLVEEAAPHWLEAARRSLAHSALTEGTRLLKRGLGALEKLPDTVRNRDLRLQLSALLGPALIGLKGAKSTDTRELYTMAYELCRELPEDPSHFPIYWGWWRLSSDGWAGLERAATLLKRALSRNDPELMLQAHHCSWASHGHVGAFDPCIEHARAGLAIYHQGDYTHHARLYGNHDAKVCAHGNLCQMYWMQGKLAAAKREETQCLTWGDKIDHLGSRIHSMGLTLLHRVYAVITRRYSIGQANSSR